jgi:hypothetical protein
LRAAGKHIAVEVAKIQRIVAHLTGR